MITTIKKHFTTLFLQDLQEKAGNTIFSVEFYKKNGEYRKLKGRFGVTKGITGKGSRYDALARGMFRIYDVEKGGFRTITVGQIEQLKIKGTTYKFGA